MGSKDVFQWLSISVWPLTHWYSDLHRNKQVWSRPGVSGSRCMSELAELACLFRCFLWPFLLNSIQDPRSTFVHLALGSCSYQPHPGHQKWCTKEDCGNAGFHPGWHDGWLISLGHIWKRSCWALSWHQSTTNKTEYLEFTGLPLFQWFYNGSVSISLGKRSCGFAALPLKIMGRDFLLFFRWVWGFCFVLFVTPSIAFCFCVPFRDLFSLYFFCNYFSLLLCLFAFLFFLLLCFVASLLLLLFAASLLPCFSVFSLFFSFCLFAFCCFFASRLVCFRFLLFFFSGSFCFALVFVISLLFCVWCAMVKTWLKTWVTFP